ncbi:MAG: IclR family transcriptional regulator [Thermoguttaceae bacterium]|jgi:DNA-binding IclR family transcriptional regulator
MNSTKGIRSYSAPAVTQAVRLIELLCQSDRPLGVSEIAEQIGVNKHTTIRLLSTLHTEGWVVRYREGPKYAIGLRPFHHTSKAIQRLGPRVAAEEPLRALWQATGQTTWLGVLDGDEVLYIEHFDATGNVKIVGRIGGRYPLHCSAPGKVLLAYAGEPLLRQLAKRSLVRQTKHTLCDLDELRIHLRQVVSQGYAIDVEEYAEGVLCFAAPLFDYAGNCVAAIGQSVLTLHFTPERFRNELGTRVIEVGKKVSLALGHDASEALVQPKETGRESP